MAIEEATRFAIEGYVGPIDTDDLPFVEHWLGQEGDARLVALRIMVRDYREMARTPAVSRGGSVSASHQANLKPMVASIEALVGEILSDTTLSLTDAQSAFVSRAAGGDTGVVAIDTVATNRRPG